MGISKEKLVFLKSASLSKDSQCINWPYILNKDGYGSAMHNKIRGAHRIVYYLAHGNIADEMCVMHSCDNPACINIQHLSLGTAKENHSDMYKKNRCVFQKGVINYKEFRGESHGLSKLTEDEVRKIRISREKGGFSNREIAKILNMGRQTINDVISRKTWAHVS